MSNDRDGGQSSPKCGRCDGPGDGIPGLDGLDDDLLRLLSNRRRRWVLAALASRDGGPVAVRDLATWLTAAEREVPAETVGYRDRRAVQNALAGFHLPRMHRVGLVAYDHRAGTVRQPTVGGRRPLTDGSVARRRDDGTGSPDDDNGGDGVRNVRWPTVYATLAVVAGAGLVGSVAGIPPFGGAPPHWWGVALAAVIVTVATVDGLSARRSGRQVDPPDQRSR